MKTKMILFFVFVFLFVGCAEKDIEQQRQECIEDGKKFTTTKVFNHREGKYILKGECN